MKDISIGSSNCQQNNQYDVYIYAWNAKGDSDAKWLGVLVTNYSFKATEVNKEESKDGIVKGSEGIILGVINNYEIDVQFEKEEKAIDITVYNQDILTKAE